ncbi:hypothetical protein [Rhizobium sp. BK176]|uniref:hypothetical protein n=1 Tax=Rhizobium sp. BK176 TaxID=2587071 RepID=UPI00216A05A9|nr:hypothetical protein [Rhizobium sp. BK176]MCS4090082.1 hypothetical protein [Rhizobium sp. BK176]
MRLEFRHPAIARGIHQRTLLERTMVGMVSTPVEIPDLSREDVVKAFEIEGSDPEDDYEIVQHDGLLYREAAFDITELLGDTVSFPDMHDRFDLKRNPFRPLGDALATRIREIVDAGDVGSLFPAPRSSMVYDRKEPPSHAILPYLSRSNPMPSTADSQEVESWREAARRFFSNFILVDGRTYSRTGIPLYCAGNTRIQPASTNVYQRYLDTVLPSPYGGTRPGHSFRHLLGVMVQTSEWNEARRIRRDMAKITEQKGPMLDSPRIVSHVDVHVEDLERLEMLRIAKIHLWEARDSLRDFEMKWGQTAFERATSNPASEQSILGAAAVRLRQALDAHELHGADVDVVESGLRAIAPLTMKSRLVHHSNTVEKQARCKCLDVMTKIAFERFEAKPIDVPIFSRQVTPPKP